MIMKSTIKVVSLPAGIEGSEQAWRWAEDRFDRSLIILGDSTKYLMPYSHHFAAYEHVSFSVFGLAVRFTGFERPVVSVAADDPIAFRELLQTACCGEGAIVAVGAEQRLHSNLGGALQTLDTWLVAPSLPGLDDPPEVKPIRDEQELRDFYDKQGMHFWCPAMLRIGHAFGIRGPDGTLVCAGSVNFTLPRLGYAQIGALATHPAHRGRSFANRVLIAIRSSLSRADIRECGLFADATNPQLPTFYLRQGFSVRGSFRFIEYNHSSQEI